MSPPLRPEAFGHRHAVAATHHGTTAISHEVLAGGSESAANDSR